MKPIRPRSSPLAAALAVVALAGCVEAPDESVTEAALGTVYTLYMSPSGSDSNDGLSMSMLGPGRGPLRTIQRVHDVLQERRPYDQDIEVRIAHGTYVGQSVDWTYTPAGHSISFMPVDYLPGDTLDDLQGRPVFTGDDGSGVGASPDWFFDLRATSGAPTRVRFYFLKIQKYVPGGIRFNGTSDRSDTGWNGYNEVRGCLFYRIGNKAVNLPADQYGYGAIDLVNSRFNLIVDNDFQYVRNEAATASHIHAVYLAHNSSYNRLIGNRYYKINGDPIKVRDYSNFNVIDGGGVPLDFNLTGRTGFYQDWYCLDGSPASGCGTTTPNSCSKLECPSFENTFRNNELVCGHSGDSISTLAFFPADRTCVPSWCPPPDPAWVRVRTSGNDRHCP